MLKTETLPPATKAILYLNRIPRPLLVVFVSLLPAVVTALLLFGYLRADLHEFLPLKPQ